MLILRQVNEDGTQFNSVLGEAYSLVLKKQDPEFVNRYIESQGADSEGLFGVISFRGGSKLAGLYDGKGYYIMSETGHTVDTISHPSSRKAKERNDLYVPIELWTNDKGEIGFGDGIHDGFYGSPIEFVKFVNTNKDYEFVKKG